MQETWVQSLGRGDPLEEEMAPNSSILAWETPWTEKPGGLQSMEPQRVGHDLATEHTHIGNLNSSCVRVCVCVRTFCCTVYVHIHVHTLMSVNYMPDRNAMEPCSCHFPIGVLT